MAPTVRSVLLFEGALSRRPQATVPSTVRLTTTMVTRGPWRDHPFRFNSFMRLSWAIPLPASTDQKYVTIRAFARNPMGQASLWQLRVLFLFLSAQAAV